ncbi:hypothetical protein QMK17_23930 [Rhodococcus sp. G-MC3]|uniref:hypothetical protein n=1 Tax=Rhodococcus sp. G-MC3 TaxID=3046209 RepID=UPI0024BB48CD|nr:hypothetical protein [Rhodococcus sp. G-MC3]MDJ0396359.1 hypothetical protein [Rhodococcus sp. G-MC3]
MSDVRPILRVVYRVVLLLVFPAFALGAISSIFLIPGLSMVERSWFLAAAACSAFFVLVLCVQSILIAQHRFVEIAWLQFVQPGVIAITVLVGWLLFHVSLQLLLVAYIAGTLVAALSSILQVRVSFFGSRLSMKTLSVEGVRYAGSQIAETASNTVVLLFAIVAMGAAQTGFLSVAITLASLPLAGGYAIGSGVFKSVASATPAGLLYVRALAVRTAAIGGMLVALLLVLVTPFIVPFLFGSEFEDAVIPAMALICFSPIVVVNYVATQVLGAEGRGGQMSTWQILGAVLSVLGLFLFSPAFGALGGVFGVASGWLVTFCGTLFALRVGPSVLRFRVADIKASFDLCVKGKV